MPMTILLAYRAHAGGASDPYTSLLPVGLCYINALLKREGHSSRVANLSGRGWKGVEALLKTEKPAILGISQFTHNRMESLRLAALAKGLNPGCFVVLGGPHATSRAREVLLQEPSVDAVVLGEGEETFLELANSVAEGMRSFAGIRGIAFRSGNEVVFTPSRGRIEDLDSLPLPAAFLDDSIWVDLHNQLEFIVTSRGCPFSCRFCSSPSFWGRRVRFRSPRSIVDEIRYIRDRYGLIYFSLRDDTFTLDRERALEFCTLLIRERVRILWNCQTRANAVDEEMLMWMKRAGCECIQLGVESGSLKVLRELGKDITPEQVRGAALAARKAGMNLSVYLITGVPGETEEDLEETLRLIGDIRASDGQVSPLAYYPGTEQFERDAGNGLVAKDLFESERSEAFYVREDSFVARSTGKLLAELKEVAVRSRYRARDFRSHKETLGYCHATNALAGGFYEEEGKFRSAESEYKEITVMEPDNPWGWLLLGELYGACGYPGKTDGCFERLERLVPNHASVRKWRHNREGCDKGGAKKRRNL
jgi:radical SAM superfamily enzyme YgiQ (UPF0313 family)